MGKSIDVAAAVIVQDGKVLAALRGHGELAGGWEFPGGKLEGDETFAEACVREVKEELDVDVAGLKPFVALDYDYPGFHMHLETFVCHIAAGSVADREHDDLRWLTPAELDDVNWLPADHQVVNALRALGSNGYFTEQAAQGE